MKNIPIASAFAPNYTKKDFLIALKEIFYLNKYNKNQEAEKLEKKFSDYMECGDSISFNSGRSGFYAILKALDIKKGDEIILQAFTTIALPNIIRLLGAKPVYIDIEENTYNINTGKIEEKINEKTKAIIIQHTFGSPAKIEEIVNIAKKYNLYTIEDCAHSLGATYKNKKTGFFSDAAFFSFGRDKVISSVSGGMVIAKNNEIFTKIRKVQQKMKYPLKKDTFKNLLHPIITMTALYTYNFFNIGKIIMFTSFKLKILNKAYLDNEKRGDAYLEDMAKMPSPIAKIALHQIDLLEKFNRNRIKISKEYSARIKNSTIIIPKKEKHTTPIYLWYTILVKDKNKFIKQAKKNNLIFGDWFPKPIGPKESDLKKAGYDMGSCPMAEKVSKMCVNLPTHHNIREKDIEKIINFINHF